MFGRQELDVRGHDLCPRTEHSLWLNRSPAARKRLQVAIKSTRDTGLFKNQLKTFLLSRTAYPVHPVLNQLITQSILL